MLILLFSKRGAKREHRDGLVLRRTKHLQVDENEIWEMTDKGPVQHYETANVQVAYQSDKTWVCAGEIGPRECIDFPTGLNNVTI